MKFKGFVLLLLCSTVSCKTQLQSLVNNIPSSLPSPVEASQSPVQSAIPQTSLPPVINTPKETPLSSIIPSSSPSASLLPSTSPTLLPSISVSPSPSATVKPEPTPAPSVTVSPPPESSSATIDSSYVAETPFVNLTTLGNDSVVFNSSTFGLKDIFVFYGDSSNLRKITLPFAKVEQAFASWTGNNILFVGDGAVYTVNTDGSKLQHIRNGSLYNPAYSTDVKNILYSSIQGGLSDIYGSAFHGSNYIRITTTGTARDASFSPDNSKIVFVEDNINLKISDNIGNNKVKIYTGKELSFPVWSPDGKKIAFIQKDDDTTYNLYTINIDGTVPLNLTKNELKSGVKIFRTLKWSKDSGKIFYTSNISGEGVYAINVDASAFTKIPVNFATAPACCDSFTGKMMYVSNKEGTEHTYMKTLDTNQEVEISETPARQGKIFYNRNYYLFAGNDGIYWAPDNSSIMTKIPNTTGDATYPEWTPDGRVILNFLGGSTVYLTTLDGLSVIGIPLGNAKNGHFEMSPDGSKVVYTSIKPAEVLQNVFTMNGDTSNKTQITNTGNNSYPVWSPDGTKIAFDSDRTGRKEIFIMNADGTGQTAITNFGAYEPKWSPDGKKIGFTTEKDGKKAIYTINTDRTGLQKLMGDNINNYYLVHWK